MKDYTYLYRDQLPISEDWQAEWDLFISAFNSTDRVSHVFEKARAAEKHWLIHNEYGYSTNEYPPGVTFSSSASDEAEFMLEYFDAHLSGKDLGATRICVDITGFMRPHLMFLVKLLVNRGVSACDVIYTEPAFYSQQEETKFSEGFVHTVRQVAGFEGTVNNDTSGDLLIIGAGYENRLIDEVADDKEMAKKLILLGLPSLRADMYQQNALRAQLAADSVGDTGSRKYFAPANDPFVTATVLSEMREREGRLRKITNLYLSPLTTKPQALGFTLFYIAECQGKDASIIYPFSSRYARDASEGLSKIWRYRLEFPLTC